MNRSITALMFTAATGLAFSALAQPPAPPQGGQQPQPQQPQVPQPQQQETVDVSSEELDTFTTIYVEVREISEEYESRMASVEDGEEAQRLQSEMRDESLSAIEDHGWTQQQYSQTARAINADQELLEEAMALIDEKS